MVPYRKPRSGSHGWVIGIAARTASVTATPARTSSASGVSMSDSPSREAGARVAGRGRDQAVHARVAPRLQHQRPPQVVVAGQGVAALLEEGRPFELGVTPFDDPDRLAGGVHVHGANDDGSAARGHGS